MLCCEEAGLDGEHGEAWGGGGFEVAGVLDEVVPVVVGGTVAQGEMVVVVIPGCEEGAGP